MIKIQKKDFDIETEINNIKKYYSNVGAVNIFVGYVRDINENKDVKFIELDVYTEMAIKELSKIKNIASKKWNLSDCTIIHRIGELKISEKIVLVIAAAPHRSDCIKACEYIIDTLKVNVAFWKFHIKGKEKESVDQKKKDIDKYLSWSQVIS